MFVYIMTRWAVRLGSVCSGAYLVWSDQVLYRLAALGIFLFFVLLWARATIRRGADAKFAEVLQMAEARRRS